MKLIISSKLMMEMQAMARSASPEEICGLLLGRNNRVDSIRAAKNVAVDRQRHFEIDPAMLITAERDMRNGGMPIVGYYHSHPGNKVEPSPTDAVSAAPDGRIWLIINGTDAAAWQATESGRLLDRFNPVELECPLD
ncbi:Mov34/MPN/PAD-1 family protein [Parasphingorhabdus marina]|nr:M67 family metallopeptidase [Parasphingorhabdus marina]